MMRRSIAVTVVVALALLAGAGLLAQGGPAPGAPSRLTYQVSGGNVFLNWISSTGMNPTFSPTSAFYRLEAAPGPGAPPFFVWDSASLGDTPESRKMFYMLTDFAAFGVGPGLYHVRVRGVNNGVEGPISNEIAVPVTGGCQAPGAPTDFTAITRGDTAYLAWNDGNGGVPANYVVLARNAPASSGAGVIAALPTGKGPERTMFNTPIPGGYLNVAGVPAGQYYVQVTAANACGTSAPSNEIVVNAPNNSPTVRTADAASGKLPYFNIRDLVLQIGNEARSRGALGPANSFSCPSRPGFPDSEIEARKTQRNAYIDYMVQQLRLRFDQRIGYNAKPTRENAIIAGDEIAFQWGSDAPQGSPSAYFIDTLGGHCTFGRESVDYRPFFLEYGRWTSAGAFSDSSIR